MPRRRDLSSPDVARFTRRAMAWTGLAIAATFAISHACMPNGILPIDFAIWFANGFAVAVYAVPLRAAGPARGRLAHCLVLAFLGMTHFLWLLASPLEPLLGASIPAQNAGMFIWTGLVFGVVIFAGLFTWQSAVTMAIATAASAAAAYLENLWPAGLRSPHAIGFPAMFLHLGIALTLFDAARRSLPSPAGHCPSCGYLLAGLSGERCPECGEVARRSAARPASEGRAT